MTGKLGNCPKCLRWALIGAGFCYATCAFNALLPRLLLVVISVIAFSLSFLAVAHLAAVSIRMHAVLRPLGMSATKRLITTAQMSAVFLKLSVMPHGKKSVEKVESSPPEGDSLL
ncbi:hypothetical protein ILP97_08810 [Amycolatopsis sp. H6(2020)]|nr:hypothetical protein [Amycolatopsis sp. H6(2020)]